MVLQQAPCRGWGCKDPGGPCSRGTTRMPGPAARDAAPGLRVLGAFQRVGVRSQRSRGGDSASPLTLGHLLMSGDNFGCHIWGRGAVGIKWAEARGAAGHHRAQDGPRQGSMRPQMSVVLWWRALDAGEGHKARREHTCLLVRQGAHFFRGCPVRISSGPAMGALCSLGACAPSPVCGTARPQFPPSSAAACWQKPEHGARVAGLCPPTPIWEAQWMPA